MVEMSVAYEATALHQVFKLQYQSITVCDHSVLPHFRVTVWRKDLVPTLHVTFRNYHTSQAINRKVGGDIHIKQHDINWLP
jgi:hypothetical protein